jgi:signal transduction histidine kinase
MRLAFKPHLPRRTLRLRLTLLYGGLFLLSGAALLGITYVLVVHNTKGFVFTGQNGLSASIFRSPLRPPSPGERPRVQQFDDRGHRLVTLTPQKARAMDRQARLLEAQSSRQHASELHQLLIQSGIALASMAVLSMGLGWIVAGRVLRPLRTITTAARDISASNLHRRLALTGPNDELKALGDTFDELLARLERAFRAQRRFVANASHELRTPLAVSRAMLQVALVDPDLTLDSLRATCEEVLDAGKEHEQLIEALLMLARSQRGLDHRQEFDLASIVHEVVEAHQQHATAQGVTVDCALSTAPISGDSRLAQRLVSNLVENALRYNTRGGLVRVMVNSGGEHATLTVANTGPVIPAEQIDRLLQPFHRLGADRASEDDGHGLGLSIVAAIATAHDATLTIRPQADGGLHVKATFPGGGARPNQTAPSITTASASDRQPALKVTSERDY